MSVDLPAPLSPTSAMTSPLRISKSTSVSACTEPNDLETPRSSSRGVSVMGGVSCGGESGGARRGASARHHVRTAYLQYFANSPLQTSLFFMYPLEKSFL